MFIRKAAPAGVLVLTLGLAAPALAQATTTDQSQYPAQTQPGMQPGTQPQTQYPSQYPAQTQPMSPTTSSQSDPTVTTPAPMTTDTQTMSPTADTTTTTTTTTTTVDTPAQTDTRTMANDRDGGAPDGSSAFGIEPYFGIMGGYDMFDRRDDLVSSTTGRRFEGAVIEGILGVNIPLGPLFVGVEGFGAKGFGPIDWEYGARARAGLRAGESGLVYVSFGHTWIDAKNDRGFPNRRDWVYGVGFEVGPRDIGLGGVTGRAGPRLRVSVESYDFKSIRPMAGIIFHF